MEGRETMVRYIVRQKMLFSIKDKNALLIEDIV